MNGKVVMVSRYLLGLIMTVFGLNGLMMIFAGKGFIPLPAPTPEMGAAMGGLFAAQYLMPLVKIIEVAGGLMLLSNKYVNAAIMILGPIVINIFLMHLFLDMGGLPMGAIVLITWGILLNSRCSAFKKLLCD